MCKVSWIKDSIHNVESGKFANKTLTINSTFVEETLIASTMWILLCDIFHNEYRAVIADDENTTICLHTIYL